jgi:hypothetical protein
MVFSQVGTPKFNMYIVNKRGEVSSKRIPIKGKYVRCDDDEEFRVLFENDWQTGGDVTFHFDEDGEDVTIEGIEQGDLVVSPQTFRYRRTEVGGGRLLECCFVRTGLPKCVQQVMLINNDFNRDGTAVEYGAKEGDGVRGRAERAEDNPDLGAQAS